MASNSSYEQSAQYILDKIQEAGFSDPRAIYRLTQHLYVLTYYAAIAAEREMGL